MPDITRVAIITDPMMVKLGYVDRVIHYLHQRQTPVAIEVFSEVEPDPSTVTVERGTEMMRRFNRIASSHWAAVRQWMRLKACGCSMNIQILISIT